MMVSTPQLMVNSTFTSLQTITESWMDHLKDAKHTLQDEVMFQVMASGHSRPALDAIFLYHIMVTAQ